MGTWIVCRNSGMSSERRARRANGGGCARISQDTRKSGNGCSINPVQIPCMKDGLGSIRTARYKGEWLSPVLIVLLTVTL